MSAEATGWVYRHSPATGTTFTVHLAIADSVNDQHGYELWMRVPRLAAKTRVHPGTVRRAISELLDAGLLEEMDDGRATDDAGSATRPRRFRFLMPDDAAVVWDSRTVRGSTSPQPAHGARGPRMVREEPAHGARGPRTVRGRSISQGEPKTNPSQNARHRSIEQPQQQQLVPAAATAPATYASGRGHDVAFEAFWSAYPRKVGKVAARKAWTAALRRAPDSTLIAGAQRYAADPNRDDEFTCHPTTWLNQGRWDDAPLPQRNRNRNRTEQALARMVDGPLPRPNFGAVFGDDDQKALPA